jgi:hypothetical protein
MLPSRLVTGLVVEGLVILFLNIPRKVGAWQRNPRRKFLRMHLPNAERATVPSRKITHYLLSTAHRDGRHKAEFFRRFGFKLEGWEELASALLNHARRNEVVEIVPTPFGRNYVIEGALPAPDGRSPQVRAIWFIAKDAETATLATAYPSDN